MYQKGKLDKLYDSQAALYVLSSIMKNPLLIQDDSYVLDPTDFFKPIHKMIFVAIYNLEQQGIETIEPSGIDLYLSHYDAQYNYYKAQNGYSLVQECSRMALSMDPKEFLYYYSRLKKFSLLRDLECSGIDTNTFYKTTPFSGIIRGDSFLTTVSLHTPKLGSFYLIKGDTHFNNIKCKLQKYADITIPLICFRIHGNHCLKQKKMEA
jgi:hypothetical protein